MKIKIFLTSLLILGALGLIAGLISYSQTSTKYVDKRLVYALDNIFAQIPGVEKTSRQILVRASVVNPKLKSYKTQVNLKLGNEKINVIDITTTGSIRDSQGESSSQTQTKGKLLTPIQAEFDFETFNADTDFFFKVNQGVKLSGFDTSELKDWHKLDLMEMEKDLKVDIRDEKQIVGDIQGQLEKYFDEEAIEGQISKKEISKDGKTYFQLETVLKEDPLSKTLLTKNQSVESKLQILVEKETYFLSELKLSPVKEAQLNLTFNYTVSEHNGNFSLEEPKNPKKVNNPVELYALLSGGSPTPENLLNALGGEVKDVSTTLLTIERLTKVILLVPKSI